MTWQAYQPAALLIGIPLAVAFLLPFINILFGKGSLFRPLWRRPCIVPITIWISCSVAKSDG